MANASQLKWPNLVTAIEQFEWDARMTEEKRETAIQWAIEMATRVEDDVAVTTWIDMLRAAQIRVIVDKPDG